MQDSEPGRRTDMPSQAALANLPRAIFDWDVWYDESMDLETAPERVEAYIETAKKILDSGIIVYGDQLALLVREVHSPDPDEVAEAIRQVRFSGDYGAGITAPLSVPAF